MSHKHIFDLGDTVRYEDSIEGKVIYVTVDEDDNTIYIVDFKNSCGKFLARDLIFVR